MRAPAAALTVVLALAGAGVVVAQPALPRSETRVGGVVATPGPAPFKDGETLTFAVKYRGFYLGDAIMKVDATASFEGKPAIHLVSKGSGGALFFKAQGSGESWIDPVGLFSLGFVSETTQSGQEREESWTFDYEHGLATRHRVRRDNGTKTKDKKKDFPLSMTHVQDPQSMLYFLRAFDLAPGKDLESNVFVGGKGEKVWKLTVKVEARDKIKVPAGTFECLRVKPEATLDGKKQEKGEMTLWVTDDARKIPVRIDSETPYGEVKAILTKLKEGT